ncbi:hypothetical protein DFA_03856 [Cavenderia fasciculata]|uniref:Uncharacterized protein n=1 Tax=Cavenderia fasciculata TaxID=261658 RepID=F4Q0L1_CACFS|nr:hypothetical protein DFA_03856 [Cavenderia fasciculata]EGG18362.1 hypothetical protein DFA_03856 [Cavenderia fasciculata]|eukprot:XP_004366266.1 hypothetical protein DFA_03856 [Cavenderia fasciculata]
MQNEHIDGITMVETTYFVLFKAIVKN